MNLGGKEDVGEMSKQEFCDAYKSNVKIWEPQDSLTAKIKTLRTGTLL
jgi:hypothetical protein